MRTTYTDSLIMQAKAMTQREGDTIRRVEARLETYNMVRENVMRTLERLIPNEETRLEVLKATALDTAVFAELRVAMMLAEPTELLHECLSALTDPYIGEDEGERERPLAEDVAAYLRRP